MSTPNPNKPRSGWAEGDCYSLELVPAPQPRRRWRRWLLGLLLIGLLVVAAVVAVWLHKAQRIDAPQPPARLRSR